MVKGVLANFVIRLIQTDNKYTISLRTKLGWGMEWYGMEWNQGKGFFS